MLWTWIIAVALPTIVWLVALAQTSLTVRRVPCLENEPRALDVWPGLSIITPACNEEATIGTSLGTALATEYPSLQVVAIDDRSTDHTGHIIQQLAEREPRLVHVRVDELPPGWLGKLNAMQRGVERADGDWLLFADADTRYAPGALRRAVAYAERHGLDLLTAYPELTSTSFGAGTVFAAAPVLAQLSMPMWRVNVPGSDAYAGFGAFILVRRAALERTPGLAWIKLDVADDMGLGLLIKRHGGRIGVVNGRRDILIEFYASLGEMVRAMQKNWWAIMARFSVARAVGLSVLLLWMALAPWAVLLPGAPVPARVIAGVGLLALTGASVLFNRWVRRPLGATLVPSVGLLLCVFMLLRATVIGRRIGGIAWRGRLYRTEELRDEQRVRV